MKSKSLKVLFILFLCSTFEVFSQDSASNKANEENQEQDLESYLEEYRILSLDFKKDILFNYYLDIFLRVAKEKVTYEKDITLALKYFNKARNLKKRDRLVIIKSVIYSEEVQALDKKRISLLYESFSKNIKDFNLMMSEEIRVHLEKLELSKMKYVTQKGILELTVKERGDDSLLKLYCRLLITRGQFKACADLLQRVKNSVKPVSFQNLQIETLLYEGDIRLAKTLLESSASDFSCKKTVTGEAALMKRRLVAIFHRLAGEFKKSLECLKPLEENKNTTFYYYYDGMKAARFLDKNTTNYLFKKAAQFANRKASKFQNVILDWEEVKNSYFEERLNIMTINEVISTMRVQGFRPIMVAADNLKQNISQKSEDLVKHPKLKYLELLDIYWLVTLKKMEIKRRNKKK